MAAVIPHFDMEVTENMEENREELMQILEETRPDIDFENETALIDKEMLDSFDIIAIVSEINQAFDISINVNDLLPENFNSVDAILALIAKLQEE
jgi:acyl carrier protein